MIQVVFKLYKGQLVTSGKVVKHDSSCVRAVQGQLVTSGKVVKHDSSCVRAVQGAACHFWQGSVT